MSSTINDSALPSTPEETAPIERLWRPMPTLALFFGGAAAGSVLAMAAKVFLLGRRDPSLGAEGTFFFGLLFHLAIDALALLILWFALGARAKRCVVAARSQWLTLAVGLLFPLLLTAAQFIQEVAPQTTQSGSLDQHSPTRPLTLIVYFLYPLLAAVLVTQQTDRNPARGAPLGGREGPAA